MTNQATPGSLKNCSIDWRPFRNKGHPCETGRTSSPSVIYVFAALLGVPLERNGASPNGVNDRDFNETRSTRWNIAYSADLEVAH